MAPGAASNAAPGAMDFPDADTANQSLSAAAPVVPAAAMVRGKRAQIRSGKIFSEISRSLNFWTLPLAVMG